MAEELVTPAHSEPKHEEHSTQAHHDDDKTIVMGRELPFPIYTVVYGALALLTIIEVGLSQLPHGFLTIPLLLLIALFKAGLVVWFYMHLKTDSRIFAITLLLPVVMVVIATLFLMIVPTGY
jgi:cytochrome c oxidase subunit 4